MLITNISTGRWDATIVDPYEAGRRSAGLVGIGYLRSMGVKSARRYLDTLVSNKFEVICSLSYKKYFQSTITGRYLDSSLISELKQLPIDPCGEQGEYHTWVLDAPFFKTPVQLEDTQIVDAPEYCHLTYESAI